MSLFLKYNSSDSETNVIVLAIGLFISSPVAMGFCAWVTKMRDGCCDWVVTKSQAPPAHTDLRVQRSWTPVTSSEEQSVWPRSVPSFIDIQNWAEKHWTSKRPKDSEQGRRQSNWFIIIPASLASFSLVYLILSWKIKLWSHFFFKKSAQRQSWNFGTLP